MCAAHVCVEDYSFRSEEGILLNVFVFCFRYDSVCPLVYTVMALANSRCAANRTWVKLVLYWHIRTSAFNYFVNHTTLDIQRTFASKYDIKTIFAQFDKIKLIKKEKDIKNKI